MSKVNVSEAVRNYLSGNKGAKPKEVSEALKKEGVHVTPSYVSNIKANLAKSSQTKGKGKRKKRTARAALGIVAAAVAGDLSAKEQIAVIVNLKKAVKPITKKLTPEQAKQSLEILSELVYD